MPAHPCNFIKQGDHLPCAVIVRSLDPDECCGMHRPIKARMPPLPEHSCEHIVKGGIAGDHWCGRVHVAGERLCVTHVAMRERELAAFRRRQEAARAWAHDPMFIAQQAAAVEEARAQPVRPLARFAQDRQNVHTAAIVRQTNAGEEKLLAVKTDGKPVGLKILRVFAARAGHLHHVLEVMNDVDHWYRQMNCRINGDRLYGRVLEGLWTLIQQQPEATRHELQRRLWEEMCESVAMCCEGHLSRLVNVMVGFDESFKPPVSVGEMLQTKMSAIAGGSLSNEEKLAQARVVMAELAVPDAEQTAWLEALV